MKNSEILAATEKVSAEAETICIDKKYLSVDLNPVKTVFGSGSSSGRGLRMIRNGKLGVAGQWGPVKPYELVDRAIGSCRYGPDALFSLPEVSPESTSAVPDSLSGLNHEEASDYLLDIQKGVRNTFPDASLSARVKWGEDSFSIANSRGLRGNYSKSTASTFFTVTMPSPDGLLQSGYSIDSSCSLPSANDVVEMLSLPLSRENLEKTEVVGRKKVILSPLVFSVMLQGIRAGVSGRLLARGASPLAHMEGRNVLGKLLTVRDMPELSNGAASAPFDSEGIPAENKTLFREGIFQDFIHDLSSAAETGAKSTGSSGRNLGEHSRPVCTNLVVDTSDTASVNTMKETGSGILITDVLSADSGNAASGHFTFDCGRVYLFRRGEVYGYYDGCVITGNVYDVLSRVTAVGGRQFRCNSDLLPFVSLEGVSVR